MVKCECFFNWVHEWAYNSLLSLTFDFIQSLIARCRHRTARLKRKDRKTSCNSELRRETYKNSKCKLKKNRTFTFCWKYKVPRDIQTASGLLLTFYRIYRRHSLSYPCSNRDWRGDGGGRGGVDPPGAAGKTPGERWRRRGSRPPGRASGACPTGRHRKGKKVCDQKYEKIWLFQRSS